MSEEVIQAIETTKKPVISGRLEVDPQHPELHKGSVNVEYYVRDGVVYGTRQAALGEENVIPEQKQVEVHGVVKPDAQQPAIKEAQVSIKYWVGADGMVHTDRDEAVGTAPVIPTRT